jgi:hypothetical protein
MREVLAVNSLPALKVRVLRTKMNYSTGEDPFLKNPTTAVQWRLFDVLEKVVNLYRDVEPAAVFSLDL